MSSTTPLMRLHGLRMLDAGYHVVPIIPSKKSPGEYANGKWFPMAGWSKFAHLKPPEELVEMWSIWPGAGVGIVTGGLSGVIGVDVDILDEALASQVRLIIQSHLGETPLVRVGRQPKVMLVYRVDKPMSKIAMHPIEVLATGQQFVAYGVHPQTGLDYHWPVESPDDTTVESLPLVTEEQVRAAANEAYATLPEEMKTARWSSLEGAGAPGGISETSPATPEAIAEALEHIPNDDLQWGDWKRILMAVYVSSRGAEQSYFEFLKWSRKSIKNNDNSTRNEWTGCRVSPPSRVSFGTLHFLATQNGWIPSEGLVFNQDTLSARSIDVSGFDAMPTEGLVPIPFVSPIARTRVRDVTISVPDGHVATLSTVGVSCEVAHDTDIGEVIETLYPISNREDLTGPNIVDDVKRVSFEAVDETNIFDASEPKQLKLTQAEIDHGSLSPDFAAEFPQEWLYTNSLIGRTANWIDSCCLYPQRLYALMAAFTLFGAVVGRQYRIRIGLRPSLAVCIIGKTGVGKEAPRKAGAKLLRACGVENLIGPPGGFSSGSGVVETLMNQISMWLPIDEMGKKIAAYGSKGDQNSRELIAMLLEAMTNDFVGGKGYANSKENKVRKVVTPNINIFGASQLEEITNSLSSAASADGLIQRFLFVPTLADYSSMRRDFEAPPPPQALVDEYKAIIERLAALGGMMATNDDAASEPNMIIVEMTSQATQYMYDLDDRKLEMLRAGRTMWVRSVAQTIKIAMLEAIATNPLAPVITVEGRRVTEVACEFSS